jgi:hypothetical protein
VIDQDAPIRLFGESPASPVAVRDARPSPETITSPRPAVRRLRWWHEVLVVALFYAAYTVIRDWRGTRPVSAARAFANARRIIHLERTLGVFHEAQIQHVVLHSRVVIEWLDVWYGSTHFIVTAMVLAVLFFRHPHRYRRWRNALAAATTLALAGFAFFPLMPPRLLPAGYGFTDTLQTVGGLWDFNSGPMPHLTDQFAAMPSLHFAWALWSGLALFAVSRHGWTRLLAVCYPAVTLVCVIVTANHYFTDTAAGALIVAAGYGATRAVETGRARRATRRASWSS